MLFTDKIGYNILYLIYFHLELNIIEYLTYP